MAERLDPLTVSVVVASFNSLSLVSRSLPMVVRQAAELGAEVIVVDSSNDGTDRLIAEEFPGVRLLHCSERKYPQQAKQLGAEHARGEVVAFIDIDCTPSDNWLKAKLAAHQDGHSAVLGRIYCHADCGLVGWAYYFIEFGYFLKYRLAGAVRSGSECNISYRRTLFESVRYDSERNYATDAIFHRALREQGTGIFFDPSHAVYHYYDRSLGHFLSHEFEHGRDGVLIDRRRGARQTWKSIVYVAVGPLLPFLKVGHSYLCLRRSEYRIAGKFFAALPLTLLGAAAWTSGAWWANLRAVARLLSVHPQAETSSGVSATDRA